MSNKILDNGTVLTLGLVGAVAAIGVAAKRGVYGSRATATQSVMERLRSQLNGQGFSFELEDDYLIVDDGASVSIVAVDSPLRPDAQGQYRPGVDEAVEPTMVEVAKRKLDRSGNLVGMKVLGQFSAHDAAGIARVISSHHAGSMKGSRFRGSRARGSLSREDFRTSHLRGDAKKLAESIKKLVRDMNGEEPDGGGCPAFITPAQRRRMGWSPVKGTVMVLVFDGGDLAPYMNPNYGDKAKYNAMQDLIRRMGYWTEYETGVEASVYKRKP